MLNFLNRKAVTKMMIMIIVAVIIIASIAGSLYYFLYYLPAKQLAPKDKIVIGIAQSLSGPLAVQVMMWHQCYKWIIDDYNAKGGLYVPEYGKKLPITYVEYDDESDINKMLTLTERLITIDKVDLIFAPASTGFCYAAFSLYEKYHYPVIALTYGSQVGAEKMRRGELKYCFQVLASPDEVGEAVLGLLNHIKDKYGPLGNIGIIHHTDQHGIEHAAAIYGQLSLAGFNIAVYESYPFMTTEFKPLISKLKEANVEALILCGYEGPYFLRDAMAENYNPKFLLLGPSGVETPGMAFGALGFTLKQLKGVMLYIGPSVSYTENDFLRQWAEEHKERCRPVFHNDYGYPFPPSATFYAALQCLFGAVEKVGLDREKIAEALRTESFNTILGKMRLRPGYSAQSEIGGGIIEQWQNRYIMEVIWPPKAASADVIYPKPPWPSS
jgi:branched-chain amino acid transport system substrate-binding protein